MKRREFIVAMGSAVAWPLAARAQERSTPIVGFMSGRSPPDSAHLVSAFLRGLSEKGFVDGQTVRIEYRWAQGDYDRLPALAADLVSQEVAVLVGVGGDVSAVAAAKNQDDSGGLWNGRRPGQGRLGCKLQPPGR